MNRHGQGGRYGACMALPLCIAKQRIKNIWIRLINIAKFILNNPNLPADKIPYWDFNAANIPNALRDASAGAIMASALLELCRYTSRKQGQLYFTTAETIIRNLSGATYRAATGTNGGFILKHSVGNLPANSEVDVPLTYADYYFIEALSRYKNFNQQ
jgi:unsaturated chondroitin disaccharide hydrolase